jgi:RND family efflux transporter MFP subunit
MSDTTNSHEYDEVGELPLAPTPSRKRLVGYSLGFVTLMALMFLAGFLPRAHRRAALATETDQLANQKPAVQVIKAKALPPAGELTLPGTVQPIQETTIYARTSGYLLRWDVDIGDAVRQGQLLAEIDTPEVNDQLRSAQATMGELKAALDQGKTQLELAKVELKRTQDLAASGFSSQQERDQREATMHVAEANIRAAQAKIASQEAEIARLAQLKSFSRVLAPFPGVITYRNTEVGSLVNSGAGAGQALFKLAKSDIVRVFVNVPQISAPSVQVGQTADVTVREYPGRPFKATVTRTSKSLDAMSHTLLTELQIKNQDGTLLPGMFAQVKLGVERSAPQLVVPANALLNGEAGTQVAIVTGGDHIHLVSVQLGEDYGTEVGILTGLNGDEQIVINAGDKGVEGLPVVVQPAGAKPTPKTANN